MLTTEDIKIVKSTVPLLAEGGTAVTQYFYQRLFRHNPELNDIFNMSNQHTGRQIEALFHAIAAYAQNIDNLTVLKQMVERIAHKHTSFHIKPEHYQVVGHHLIETLRELLPAQFTHEVELAWTRAYQVLADIFINREEQLYCKKEQSLGGWRGKRAFSVVDKYKESELVTSFIFEPIDRQPVMEHQVGQYLALEVKPQGAKYNEIRQYSLSNRANGSDYRISVKRELGRADAPQGLISNYLHEHLQVGDLIDLYAPAGDFILQPKEQRLTQPTVLISAGVGVTPMQAMLEQLHQEAESDNAITPDVYYLHACINPAQHSFKQRSAEICQSHHWPLLTWYQHQLEQAEAIANEQVRFGLMNFAAVDLPLSTGHFYLCGPVEFMRYSKTELIKLGVDSHRIHYEVFGPHADF